MLIYRHTSVCAASLALVMTRTRFGVSNVTNSSFLQAVRRTFARFTVRRHSAAEEGRAMQRISLTLLATALLVGVVAAPAHSTIRGRARPLQSGIVAQHVGKPRDPSSTEYLYVTIWESVE